MFSHRPVAQEAIILSVNGSNEKEARFLASEFDGILGTDRDARWRMMANDLARSVSFELVYEDDEKVLVFRYPDRNRK